MQMMINIFIMKTNGTRERDLYEAMGKSKWVHKEAIFK
jgi:hypothetical protein